MKEAKDITKCYMCDALGITKEHAPPDCFFPKGYRDGLWTVPSCDAHNSANSKDVEYVRNVITSHISANDAGMVHFQDKAIRSFEHSPKLFHRTFATARPVVLAGEETGVYNFDLPRHKTVMEAIAYAVYYKMFGKSYPGSWITFTPSAVSQTALLEGRPDGWDKYRQVLRQIRYTRVPTPQPKVFQLGFYQWNEDQFIFAFVFYEGFLVNPLSQPSSG
ncbi:MAG TPA: hypothetical protein VI306_08500 [Pyrinomonadaceae bacterium]